MLFLAFLLSTSLPAQPMITDDEITNHVEREMMFQADVPAHLIDAETNMGIVTLTGAVDHLLAKQRAEKVAMAIKGVKGVVNLVKVQPPVRTDEAIVKDILAALRSDPATEAYEVTVSSDDGVVTLAGTVDSWAERRLSANVAMQVKGVKALTNNITLGVYKDRSDQEILTDIRSAIANDVRLHRSMIDVQVKDGRVALSGSVGSLNSRNLAENFAWTTGVKDVDVDRLNVADWAKDPKMKDSFYPDLSDREIEEAVRLTLVYDPRVNSFQPDVEANAGVVTLSGAVDNLSAKLAAEADAHNVVGVMYVQNHLKVRPEDVPADDELETAVNRAFLRDADVESFEITPVVRMGKVTLKGTVDSYFEKNEAERIAARVPGVVEVDNQIQVDGEAAFFYDFTYPYDPVFPSPYGNTAGYYRAPMSDGFIAANIRDELWWSPFIDADKVNVVVDDGVAILTGTVSNWQERNAAIENAYEGGATEVVDRLEINRPESR